jgi:hypothetical protein
MNVSKNRGGRHKIEPIETVFIVGAGFSKGLGYPLVSDLLIRLWPKLPSGRQKRLEEIIGFHNPGFSPHVHTSYPTIERLLSQMMANEQMFKASRAAPGNFTLARLRTARRRLLLDIAEWFHALQKDTFKNLPNWLLKFRKIIKPGDRIISFNWDLVVEQLVFGEELRPESYGFGSPHESDICLLKPHGSLNWFEYELGRRIKKDRRFNLFSDESGNHIMAFKRFRSPRSQRRRYMPLIVPPVYNKDFGHSVFDMLWQYTVGALSTARNVVFLGYSLPDLDFQARFILRCGFSNQTQGLLMPNGQRATATGRANVIVVNPARDAAVQVERVAGASSEWIPFTAAEWVGS